MNKITRASRFIQRLPATIAELRQNITNLKIDIENLKKESTEKVQNLHTDLNSKIENISHKQSDILHEISEMPTKNSNSDTKNVIGTNAQAEQHKFDGYYSAFEEKFRGSEDLIFKRLNKAYGKLLSELPSNIKDSEVIDIGCGRGEFLQLYSALDMKALGLDLNKSMVDRCIKLGHKARQAEAVTYLKTLKSSSIGGVSGIHLVEHIPFEALYSLMHECFRVIKPGGFILFETPNPENLTVGAFSFWYDSSHLKPIPPEVLQFIAQYTGFSDAKIIRLHPVDMLKPTPPLQNVMSKINGPRDYSVYARKSK